MKLPRPHTSETPKVEHFYRSTVVVGAPATDYFTILQVGQLAECVTENAYRGAWCESCKAADCKHVVAVREARTAGTIPELDPITDKHWNIPGRKEER